MGENEIHELLRTAQVGRLGLSRNNQPYVVPLNFAYEKGHIYFHCADTGMKLEFLQGNSLACFEIDEFIETVTAPVACSYDTAYRSVIAFGKARILNSLQETTDALRLIVDKYAGNENAQKLEARIVDKHRSSEGAKTIVVDMTVEQMTGKHNLID